MGRFVSELFTLGIMKAIFSLDITRLFSTGCASPERDKTQYNNLLSSRQNAACGLTVFVSRKICG